MNTKQHDPYRPTQMPAQALYDAFTAESSKRKGRPLDEWVKAEREAVWAAARDYAQQHGLPVPTLDQVERQERMAMGHVDYAAKWAYGIARLLVPLPVPA